MAVLSDNGKYVTVQYGDTLTDIAVAFKGRYSSYKQLAAINGLADPDYLAIGQKIYLEDGSTTTDVSTTSTTKVVIRQFGLLSTTKNVLFATWNWSYDNTEKYKVVWYYTIGGVEFTQSDDKTVDEDNPATSRIASFTVSDENITSVYVKILPVCSDDSSFVKRVTNALGITTSTTYTASWAKSSVFYTSSLPPDDPTSAPTVEINGLTLTATLDNIDIDGATKVKFEVVKNNASTAYATKEVAIISAHASHQFSITTGSEYKVRYCVYHSTSGQYSEWSPYSSNYKSKPAAPSGITTIRAESKTSVYLKWESSATASYYEIQYVTDTTYFDSSSTSSDSTQDAEDPKATYRYVTNLTSGNEYYFRVRAVDEDSEDASEWTAAKSVILGTVPAAPTTWSTTTTAIKGEPLNLYWIHNSSDGSTQTLADLELYGYYDDFTLPVSYTFDNDKTVSDDILTYVPLTEDEIDEGKTNFCTLNTDNSIFEEGREIAWQVRTKGILDEFSEWSTRRTINVYTKPTLELHMQDVNGNDIDTLASYPFRIKAIPGPLDSDVQAPIGYHIAITAGKTYETLDEVGNSTIINAGTTVYSKYFDLSNTILETELSAGDVALESTIPYTLTCIVSMNSGLTAEESIDFVVDWDGVHYVPNAAISIDVETMTATIRPYCEERKLVYYKVTLQSGKYIRSEDSYTYVYGTPITKRYTTDGYLVYSGVTADDEEIYFCIVSEATEFLGLTMSVYRREFDGTFTEIGTGIDSSCYTTVTDPHPALDYARYRIVAIDDETGTVSFNDLSGLYVGGTAVVIQWDETWCSFEVTTDDELAQPNYSGSVLTLPYNISVSESNDRDVSLVEYIGREHPTTYYGTQQGYKATWTVDVPKSDTETLYALRRLQRWMGDVYIREPSGSGYWACISVSFKQEYTKTTIPVTLDIYRVEGGM